MNCKGPTKIYFLGKKFMIFMSLEVEYNKY